MSFFNGLIIAQVQAFVGSAPSGGAVTNIFDPAIFDSGVIGALLFDTGLTPSASTSSTVTTGTFGSPAKMALPKHKWLLIKRFLEEESRE